MDGDPPPISRIAPEALSGSKEVSRKERLMADILDNSYASVRTWTRLRGGRNTILPDESDLKFTERDCGVIGKYAGTKMIGEFVPWDFLIVQMDGESMPYPRHAFKEGGKIDQAIVKFKNQYPINEFVYVGPLSVNEGVKEETRFETEPYIEYKRQQVGKNWLGKPKYADVPVEKERPNRIVEKKVTEAIPKPTMEQVLTGKNIPHPDEQAVAFLYSCDPRLFLMNADQEANVSSLYPEQEGRHGGFLDVAIILPISIGQKLQQALQDDPLYAREIALKLIEEKYKESSTFPLPPYEVFKGFGLKMYQMLDLGKVDIPKFPQEFDPNKVIDLDSLQQKPPQKSS